MPSDPKWLISVSSDHSTQLQNGKFLILFSCENFKLCLTIFSRVLVQDAFVLTEIFPVHTTLTLIATITAGYLLIKLIDIGISSYGRPSRFCELHFHL